MAEDLEQVVEFNPSRQAPKFFGLADYGVSSSLLIDHISKIARKCEELYYENVKA